MSQQSHSNFLALPIEIRLCVYEMLGITTTNLRFIDCWGRGFTLVQHTLPTQILRVNRQIRGEALPTFRRYMDYLEQLPPKVVLDVLRADRYASSNMKLTYLFNAELARAVREFEAGEHRAWAISGYFTLGQNLRLATFPSKVDVRDVDFLSVRDALDPLGAWIRQAANWLSTRERDKRCIEFGVQPTGAPKTSFLLALPTRRLRVFCSCRSEEELWVSIKLALKGQPRESKAAEEGTGETLPTTSIMWIRQEREDRTMFLAPKLQCWEEKGWQEEWKPGQRVWPVKMLKDATTRITTNDAEYLTLR